MAPAPQHGRWRVLSWRFNATWSSWRNQPPPRQVRADAVRPSAAYRGAHGAAHAHRRWCGAGGQARRGPQWTGCSGCGTLHRRRCAAIAASWARLARWRRRRARCSRPSCRTASSWWRRPQGPRSCATCSFTGRAYTPCPARRYGRRPLWDLLGATDRIPHYTPHRAARAKRRQAKQLRVLELVAAIAVDPADAAATADRLVACTVLAARPHMSATIAHV